MYFCPTCNDSIDVNSVNDVRTHLHNHKKYGTLKYPIRCLQNDDICKSSFSHVQALLKHIRIYHPIQEDNDVVMEELLIEERQELVGNDLGLPNNHFIEQEENHVEEDNGQRIINEETQSFEEIVRQFEEELSNDIFEMLLDFRSKASVTLQTSLHAVDMISFFMTRFGDMLLEAIRLLLSTAIFDIGNVMAKLRLLMDKIKKTTTRFNSEDKIRRKYASHPLFVPPESLVISKRYGRLSYTVVDKSVIISTARWLS